MVGGGFWWVKMWYSTYLHPFLVSLYSSQVRRTIFPPQEYQSIILFPVCEVSFHVDAECGFFGETFARKVFAGGCEVVHDYLVVVVWWREGIWRNFCRGMAYIWVRGNRRVVGSRV